MKFFNLAVALAATFGSFYGGYILSKRAWQSFQSGRFQTTAGFIARADHPKLFWQKVIIVSMLAAIGFLVPVYFWIKISN